MAGVARALAARGEVLPRPSILVGRIRDIRNRHRLRRCRLHLGPGGRVTRNSWERRAETYNARPPTQHKETAIQTNFGAEQSKCMLHEVGLSTRHEPQ